MFRILRTVLALAMGRAVSTAGALSLSAGAAPAHAGTAIVQIDNPSPGEQNMSPAWIAGWAIDTSAASGTGIDVVRVYLDGDMTTGRLLGQANYGGDRADVAAQ